MRKRFVEEYSKCPNASRAARCAGYSPKTAGSQGQRLLKSPVIQKAIAKAQGKVCAKEEVPVQGILQGLAKIAFLDPKNLFDARGFPLQIKCMPVKVRVGSVGFNSKHQTAKSKIHGREYKFDFRRKMKALKLLWRYVQNFPDTREAAIAGCAPQTSAATEGASLGAPDISGRSTQRPQSPPQQLRENRLGRAPSRLGMKGRGSLLRERFVDEYLRDFNATQAAIRAGYSKKTAAQQAHRLMRSAAGQIAIAQARDRMLEKAEISVARWRKEVAAIAFADPGDCFDIDGTVLPITAMSEEARHALSGFELRVFSDSESRGGLDVPISKLSWSGKLAALGLLLEHEMDSRGAP